MTVVIAEEWKQRNNQSHLNINLPSNFHFNANNLTKAKWNGHGEPEPAQSAFTWFIRDLKS
jgi:hypothetical protein